MSTPQRGLYQDIATFDEIENSILTEVKQYLEPFLKPVREHKADRINQFVETKAPQYCSTIKYMPDALDNISPDVPEEKLEVELHKLRYKFNTEIKQQTQHLINSTVNDIENVSDYITMRIKSRKADQQGVVELSLWNNNLSNSTCGSAGLTINART